MGNRYKKTICKQLLVLANVSVPASSELQRKTLNVGSYLSKLRYPLFLPFFFAFFELPYLVSNHTSWLRYIPARFPMLRFEYFNNKKYMVNFLAQDGTLMYKLCNIGIMVNFHYNF